jgi:hypothetical protein
METTYPNTMAHGHEDDPNPTCIAANAPTEAELWGYTTAELIDFAQGVLTILTTECFRCGGDWPARAALRILAGRFQ